MINVGSVIHVAGDEQHVRTQLRKIADNAAKETGVAHMAEMQIAHDGRGSSAPGLGKIGKLYGDADDASPCSVQGGINSRKKAQAETRRGNRAFIQVRSEKERHAVNDPACTRGNKKEIYEAEPEGGDGVQNPYDRVEVLVREQGRCDEADG